VALAVGVLLIARNNSPDRLGLEDNDIPRLVMFGAILAFVGAGLLGRGLRAGEVARALIGWTVIILLLVGVYASRDQLAGLAGRMVAALAPGVPISGRLAGDADPASVIVNRSADGHFAVMASVNDKPAMLLVDTGASFVTLTHDVAAGIGIDMSSLHYDVPIHTANGMMNAAAIVIAHLAVGSIERQNVRALVAPAGALDLSLLGMTFLDTLASYAIAGDRLVLKP